MKITRAIYITCTEEIETRGDADDRLYISARLQSNGVPEPWIKVKEIEIDIPDKIIDNIISSNMDIDSKIKMHEAEIIKLEELRRKK